MRPIRSLVLVLLLAALLFVSLFAAGAEKTAVAPAVPAPETAARAMVLLETNGNTLLAARNENLRLPMASTTKIMTALVVLEHCENPDEIITIPPQAVGIEGSSVYLFAGERISVRTLLYALMLSSANDAAHALALHVGGSIEGFAALMNQKAAALGLTDTHFENPHGLPSEAHYTTARELALITAAAFRVPLFCEIVSTVRYSVPQEGTDAVRLFLNHNRLLRTYEGAVGVKTGFTKASGRCLVSAARRDGLCLIAVTLDDADDWRDAAALLDWGFANFYSFTPDQTPVPMPITGGTQPSVLLAPRAPVPSITLPATQRDVSRKILAPRFLYGGCTEGDEIATAVYAVNGKELCRISFCAEQTVERQKDNTPFWKKLLRFFGRE